MSIYKCLYVFIIIYNMYRIYANANVNILIYTTQFMYLDIYIIKKRKQFFIKYIND